MKVPRRVLVVGVGGLGCPASLALALAGVRQLTLVDPDLVELSNLHRQVWHREADIGRPKVESAAEKMRARVPGLEVVAQRLSVSGSNVEALFRAHDVVIDGVDSLSTKLLLSDASVATQTPLVYGGVLKMEGQAMRIHPNGPCLRCLFEPPAPGDEAPTCAGSGVLGTVAGLVGGLQAQLALEPPSADGTGLLFRLDADRLQVRRKTVRRSHECPACGGGRP